MLPKFQHDLALIEEDIDIANRNGSRPGPYVALMPSHIPQSINV